MEKQAVSIIQDENGKVLGVQVWNNEAPTPGMRNDCNDALRETFTFLPGHQVTTINAVVGEYVTPMGFNTSKALQE